jgi:mannose-binding lectin 1
MIALLDLSSVADDCQGGSIRAFLNDGNTDFKSHHGVDGLAFAHCDYPYRNLGRPSKLQLKQTSNGFEVVVDGNECFRSDKVGRTAFSLL